MILTIALIAIVCIIVGLVSDFRWRRKSRPVETITGLPDTELNRKDAARRIC